MDLKKCPDCGDSPFSLADRHYINIYGTCYDCDIKRWRKGELPEEELDGRRDVSSDKAAGELR